ncbi:MAG: head maturation protease, ClpP-related [Collinsella sp.]
MFRIKNEAEKATVYLYGTIGSDFWSSEESNTAKNFAKELDGLKGKPVDIRIDSLGGDVYEGFAIASAIQRYKGETTAHIDGIAASAASYIAMMADKVVMSSFAQLMIHDAWTYAQGNAQELADVVSQLAALDSTIAGIISRAPAWSWQTSRRPWTRRRGTRPTRRSNSASSTRRWPPRSAWPTRSTARSWAASSTRRRRVRKISRRGYSRPERGGLRPPRQPRLP